MDNSRPPRPRPIPIPLRRTLAAFAWVAAAGSLTLAAGCRDTFTPAAAAHADQMLEGVATRFAPNVFDARYAAARTRLGQSALVPSRIFDDSTVWSVWPSSSSRMLLVSGALAADGRYHLETRPSLSPATHPGDTRHAVTLEQVGSNQFRWGTRVELALGAVTADEVAAALDALLRAPEGRSERTIRDDYRSAFPHAAAVFGHGFALDSIGVAPAVAGATGVTLRFVFRPDSMKPYYPALAGYLDKYLGPAKYHFTLTDHDGATLFDVAGRDRAITLRYRIAEGKLVSLLGPPKPWPDSMTLRADVSLKVRLFTVGVHELATDFVISNRSSAAAHERAWTVVARREPKWDLPLITERLIRSPLRRPFEGEGSMFRLAIRDSAGHETIFVRQARLEVQESAIMRFIGSLASHALGDLDTRVEDDEHRFLHDGFGALRTDLEAIARRRTGGPE